MSLSDLAVFNEYANTSRTELLDYQVALFNAASRGGITLRPAAHSGDFNDEALWAKISGLVRRRDAYGSGAVSPKTIEQLVQTSVKVAAGTPPVRIDPGMLKWIQKSPEEAGAMLGMQLAKDSMADMLNTAVSAYIAAVANVAALYYDTDAANKLDLAILNKGRAKLGDASDQVACWIMHSKQLFDLYGVTLANSTALFQFGNVKIISDGFGNPFVVADLPSLVSGSDYKVLGPAVGGVLVEQNNDYTENVSTTNGDENLIRTFQAEWSYQLGLKGFAWDKTAGGASPSNAELATAANWDQFATSYKDCAGVLIAVV